MQFENIMCNIPIGYDEILRFEYKASDIKEDIEVLLFRSSLEYLDSKDKTWEDYFSEAIRLEPETIIIDRTTVSDDDDWFSVQIVHEPIYEASYPVRIFNKQKLISYVCEKGYSLEHEYIPDHSQRFVIEGIEACELSFVFRKRTNNTK